MNLAVQSTVVIVSYHFPPSLEVGGARTAALAEHLEKSGAPSVVISHFGGFSQPEIQSELAHRFMSTEFVRLEDPRPLIVGLLVNVKRRLGRRFSESPGSGHLADESPKGHTTASRWLHELRRMFFSLINVIDNKKKWALRAGRLAYLKCAGHHAGAVFVSGPPMTPIIGAIRAARRASVPLIVDFRDPCYFPSDSGTRRASGVRLSWLSKWLEWWAVREAAAVVCTTPSLATLLRQRYPANAFRIHYIPNGYDGVPVHQPFIGGTLHILFAGAIYLNRNPFPFLEAVDLLLAATGIDATRVRITLVGDCETFRGVRIRDWLQGHPANQVTEVIPAVGKLELAALSARATVMLNMAQGQRTQIPAKTFEQLASGKEMIVLCEADSDTAGVLQGLRGVHRFEGDDVQGLSKCLIDLYQRHVVEQQSAAPTIEEISPFSRERQNQALSKLLIECTSGKYPP